ncbi:hypothetical protein BFW01_g396 [Lasiodiplodia theobromae]|uniref:Uncharacterized protein n=1 Tax=Lasiodiplodia theobromae TaxID=45133 RepID=A0A8H7MAJ7_9PEZI|nr:hypothetical protein BFW01_g396 [Lasiodiplodia theobromae]
MFDSAKGAETSGSAQLPLPPIPDFNAPNPFDKYVVPALSPLRLALWGESAMIHLGVNIFISNYMLVPADDDFEEAAKKLLEAGFKPAPWSFGSTIDPVRFQDDEKLSKIHRDVARHFEELDRNSVRFNLPDAAERDTRVVLIRSAYVGLCPLADGAEMVGYSQYKESSLYCPDSALLLKSFVRVYLNQLTPGQWKSTLHVWCIPYMYCHLMLEEDILDACEDEEVKAWFNKNIKRGEGGVDRTTVSKRVGRK